MSVDAPAGLWSVIVPQASVNLVANPSFEVNTTGWTTTSATLTRTAGAGVFGGYGGRLLASATNGKAGFTTAAVANGSSNPFSLWVKADSALVSLKGTIGASNASQTHPGDGAWHRLSVVITAPSATTPVLEVIDGRSSAWTNVDIDGAQVETGQTAPTSYIDGDQDGCTWDGTPGASTSTRDGRDGRGGAVTAFDALGLLVKEQPGIGFAPVDVTTAERMVDAGSVYQQWRAKERTVTLLALLLGSGTTAGLHAARRTAVDALNPSKRKNNGPLVLRYTGATVTRRLRAYYEGGLEWGKIDAANEEIPLRFLAPDPLWEAETDSQLALTPLQTVAPSTAVLVRRNPSTGAWSDIGGSVGTTRALASHLDGRLLIGGNAVGGLYHFAAWDGTSFSTLGASDPNQDVYSIAVSPGGRIAIGGNFTTVGATAAVRVATWDGTSWAALGTGADNTVQALLWDNSGNLWATGNFANIGGVAAVNAAYWNGSAWASAAAGAPGVITSLALGPTGAIWGASSTGLWAWSGIAWVQIVAQTGINGLAFHGSDLYVYGSFTTFNGIAANRIIRYPGTGGIDLLANGTNAAVNDVSFGADGTLYAGGAFSSAGAAQLPNAGGIASWDGSSWKAINAAATGAGGVGVRRIHAQINGGLVAGWDNTGSVNGTGITTVTNNGTAPAYPVLRFDGTTGLYEITNWTTGQELRFPPLTIYSGETVTVDLRPGRKTVSSPLRNLIGFVQAGSDLQTWCLAPGANSIALYTNGAPVMFWRERGWSAD